MNTDFQFKEFSDYVAIFLKRWQISAVVFLSIFSIVFFLTIRKEYVYEATAKILIGDSVGQRTLGSGFNDYRNYLYEQQAFATFPFILKSQPVLSAIANRLKWADPEKEPEVIEQVMNLIRYKLAIQRVGDSRLFNINATHNNAKKAHQLANTAADVFIEQSLEKKLDTFRKSISWLADQLIDLEYKLEESQKELIDYIESERVTSFGDQQIVSNTPESDRIASEVNTTLQMLQSMKVEQDLELTELIQRYTEKHPKVIRARQALALTQRKLDLEKTSLQKEDEKKDTETIRVKQKEIKYSILKRKVDINKELYNSLIQKMKEIDIASAINDNNITVMEYASIPSSPVRPNKTRQITFGFIIALGIALFLPFGLDFLDPTLQTSEEVEEFLKLPVLASIPLFSDTLKEPFPALSTQSTEAEAFRKLRTNIRFAFPSDSGRSLIITSSGPSEGKSTVVVNLALTMAAAGEKVCIVDTDLRIPRLQKLFDIPNDKGLTNYLVGEENNLDQIIRFSGYENLYIITSGISSPKPAELLETKEMQKTIKYLKSKFDRILFDSPPAGSLIDASVLSVNLDGVIFVLQPGHINKSHIKSATAQLQRVNSNICGIVLNKVDYPKKRAYYYYYLKDRDDDPSETEMKPPLSDPNDLKETSIPNG